jgi:hypothetical protein
MLNETSSHELRQKLDKIYKIVDKSNVSEERIVSIVHGGRY